MAIGPDALEPEQRELLRRLIRGEPVEEVADALRTSVEQIESFGRTALVALDPALAALVSPDDRHMLAGRILRRDEDDPAVVELLDHSPDSRRWVLWLREALRAIAPDAEQLRLPGGAAAAGSATEATHSGADHSARPDDAADVDDTGSGTSAAAAGADSTAATDHATAPAEDDAGAAGPGVVHGDVADRHRDHAEDAAASFDEALDVPLSSRERAMVVATVIMGFMLIALGVALS